MVGSIVLVECQRTSKAGLSIYVWHDQTESTTFRPFSVLGTLGFFGAGELRVRDDGPQEGGGNAGCFVRSQIAEQAGGGRGRPGAAYQRREVGEYSIAAHGSSDIG